jgi:dipeptidyl aminopeptidase/acylaminoacyl peptidase
LIPVDLQKDEAGLFWPEAFPESNAVIFSIKDQLVVQSLRTGERRVLLQGATMASYVEPGYLLYISGENIMAVPFDVKRLQITGAPVPIVTGVLHSDTGAAMFAVSRSGSFVYAPGGLDQVTSRFVWVDRAGKITPIDAQPRPYGQFSLSPDGGRIAVAMGGNEASTEIWISDLVHNNNFSRFTFNGGLFPIWSPDGQTITYSMRGNKGLLNKASDGNGKEEAISQGSGLFTPDAWSPDGKNLLFHKLEAATAADLWLMPPEGFSKASPFIKTPAMEEQARFSPDGHWVAYISSESGRTEIYVQPFPGAGGKRQISTEGGQEPFWSPKGNELFFRNGRKMMAVDVTTSPSFSAGTPKVLFEGRFIGPNIPLGTSAISPDGQRFLMLEPVDSRQPITELRLVYNISEELKKLVPGTH